MDINQHTIGKAQNHGKRPQTSQHQDKEKKNNFRLLSGKDQNKPINSNRRPLSTNVGVGKTTNHYKKDLKDDMIDFFADAKENM